jgi:chromosome segregation ATPase
MTENEQIKHNLLLNIKRLEGILERIDKFCHNYDQEKVDASVSVLKIKSAIENLREVIPEMSKDTESIDQKISEQEEEKD